MFKVVLYGRFKGFSDMVVYGVACKDNDKVVRCSIVVVGADRL